MSAFLQKITPLDIGQLRACLDYQPQTGLLFWKRRSGVDGIRFNKRFAGKEALYGVDPRGYRSGTFFGKYLAAHRAAYAIYHGKSPALLIDHVNGDKTDNRIENLRELTVGQNNGAFRKPRNGLCVSFNKQSAKWRAYHYEGGRQIHIGTFLTKDAAVAARKAVQS